MVLTSDDPDYGKPEALARLLLQDAESDWSLVRRTRHRARYGTNHNAESLPVSSEQPAKLLSVPFMLSQPEGEPDKGEVDIATASVARCDDAARAVAGQRRLQLSRSQAWATTRPRPRKQGARRGRCGLAAGVVVVFLALLANALTHPGTRSARILPVADKSNAPAAARGNVRPDQVALGAPSAPNAVPPAPIAVPNSTQRAGESHPVATMPERAKLSDADAELMRQAQRFADLRAGQQDMRSPANQPSDQAGPETQHPDNLYEHMAQPESRMAVPPRPATGTGHPLVASSPARAPRPETAARSPRELPSVPQRLLLARAALINRDQRAARGLMEQAQTLITFQPANASPRLTVATASEVTEALIMLSRGDEAGALQRLNQLIVAIRPTS
jgi:hypothetical protein